MHTLSLVLVVKEDQILWVLRQEDQLSLEFGIHSQDIISKKKRIYYPSCCKEYGLERKRCLGTAH